MFVTLQLTFLHIFVIIIYNEAFADFLPHEILVILFSFRLVSASLILV